jgi:hypothetical protein
MRRHLAGIIALVLVGLAGVVCLYPPLEDYRAAAFVALRVGIVMGVLWLAWPDLNRLPRWAWFALPIGLIALIYARPIVVYALPVLVVATAVYLIYRRLRRPV